MAQGMRRDVPGERGFLGRRSGARLDSPAQPSHNAPFASVAGPSGHVGSRRAFMPGRGAGACDRGRFQGQDLRCNSELRHQGRSPTGK